VTITVIQGFDGMVDGDESDLDDWTDYLAEHLSAASSVRSIRIETRGKRDVQSNDILGGTDEERDAINAALVDLWERWCGEGTV
jgi:hypothetical protein